MVERRYEDRDVVGPDVVLDGEVHQPERRLEDDLVEGPAQERPVRVKDRVKAAFNARVEDAADLLEQSRRADHAMSLRSPANDGRRSNRPEANRRWPRALRVQGTRRRGSPARKSTSSPTRRTAVLFAGEFAVSIAAMRFA